MTRNCVGHFKEHYWETEKLVYATVNASISDIACSSTACAMIINCFVDIFLFFSFMLANYLATQYFRFCVNFFQMAGCRYSLFWKLTFCA